MESYVSPQEASEYYNVSIDTLRKWANEGKIKNIRTKGGHRRYCISDHPMPDIFEQSINRSRGPRALFKAEKYFVKEEEKKVVEMKPVKKQVSSDDEWVDVKKTL